MALIFYRSCPKLVNLSYFSSLFLFNDCVFMFMQKSCAAKPETSCFISLTHLFNHIHTLPLSAHQVHWINSCQCLYCLCHAFVCQGLRLSVSFCNSTLVVTSHYNSISFRSHGKIKHLYTTHAFRVSWGDVHYCQTITWVMAGLPAFSSLTVLVWQSSTQFLHNTYFCFVIVDFSALFVFFLSQFPSHTHVFLLLLSCCFKHPSLLCHCPLCLFLSLAMYPSAVASSHTPWS